MNREEQIEQVKNILKGAKERRLILVYDDDEGTVIPDLAQEIVALFTPQEQKAEGHSRIFFDGDVDKLCDGLIYRLIDTSNFYSLCTRSTQQVARHPRDRARKVQ